MSALPADMFHKAREVLDKFAQGEIRSYDVELLLIWLRDFSAKKSPFREISHFVAHTKRDCGNTFDALYKLYCRLRAYSDHQHRKQPLDLTKPLEKWFFDFLQFQLDEVESSKLKQRYGFSRKQGKRIVRESFSEHKGIYNCTKPQSPQLMAILQEAFSFIKAAPLYEKGEIIESWLITLEDLHLIDDRKSWTKHLDKIFLCFLVLMNKRTFHLGRETFGQTRLAAPNDEFGQLRPLVLRGHIQVPELPESLVTLVTTDLKPRDWVSPDLLVERETNVKGHLWTAFDDDALIQARETEDGFRLTRFPSVA